MIFFDGNAIAPSHSTASFWLDLAERIIKFRALLMGFAWTWIHYQRSRTYAQKLELGVDAKVFPNKKLYLELLVSLKNPGAWRHSLRRQGTSCNVWVVRQDLTEVPCVGRDSFAIDAWIEPGDYMEDSRLLQMDLALEEVAWFKVGLKVISGRGEWNLTRYIRVEIVSEAR